MFLRELRLRLRGGGWAASLGLFVLACALAPLGLGRDEALLRAAGPGLLWLTASLSLLLGLDGQHEEDVRAGGLDLLRLSSLPLPVSMLVKMAAGWVSACLPLVLVSPVLLFAFGATPMQGAAGALGLLLGTPALALLAGTIGALCAGVRRGTGLLVFLALPLFVPCLVFGPAAAGEAPGAPLLLLGAFSLQALAICPFVAAGAIRAQTT
nr:heme exporter protein CcmB [Parvularcula dongshanensis]